MYGIINKRTLCAHNMIHEVKKGAELMTDKVLRDASGLTEEEFLFVLVSPMLT